MVRGGGSTTWRDSDGSLAMASQPRATGPDDEVAAESHVTQTSRGMVLLNLEAAVASIRPAPAGRTPVIQPCLGKWQCICSPVGNKVARFLDLDKSGYCRTHDSCPSYYYICFLASSNNFFNGNQKKQNKQIKHMMVKACLNQLLKTPTPGSFPLVLETRSPVP
jgi:hypothetical protein